MPLINRCGGGGGTPQLCGQVENFKVIPGTTALTAALSWTAPSLDEDNSFVGARIVRKTGSAPTGINDGTVVYEGTALTYTDTGLTAGTTYYYRAFAYNAKKRYQTELRVVSVVARNISISTVLNDNTWEAIRLVSDQGQGANFWAIGDCKAVTLGGPITVLSKSISLPTTAYPFIIGFNHNSEIEGANSIHFQFGKSALSEGTDKSLFSAAIDTSTELWAYTTFRKNLGQNLAADSSTLLGSLPADLKSVLKPIVKYSVNAMLATEEAVTPTTDYIFILSAYETRGSIQFTTSTSGRINSYVKNYQKQYAYYAAGNTPPINIWLRDFAYYGPTQSGGWVYIASSNGQGHVSGQYSHPICPAFCV